MAMDWKVCEEGRVYKAKSKWKKISEKLLQSDTKPSIC